MIEHLEGVLLSRTEDRVVIQAAGVGYGAQVPAGAARALGEIGSRAALWIVTHVREDALKLYGFPTRHERDVFEILTAMPGVGPSTGLAIMSALSVAEIVQAAAAGDAARFKRVKGVGPKLAEKLLLEIRGRMDRITRGLPPEALVAATAPSPAANFGESARDAAAALEALGVAPAQAARAVAKALEALGDEAETQDIVREGLKHRRA